jgi:hypothetical protein
LRGEALLIHRQKKQLEQLKNVKFTEHDIKNLKKFKKDPKVSESVFRMKKRVAIENRSSQKVCGILPEDITEDHVYDSIVPGDEFEMPEEED